MEQLLPLKTFVEEINRIAPNSATISGMKRRCEAGRLPARKNGRAWLVEVSSPEAQAFMNQAKAKRAASSDASRIAGLEATLETAHEVNQNLNSRLELALESNRNLRERIAELERQLEVAEAKLDVALAFSGVKPKRVVVKRTPGTAEVDWAAKFKEWSVDKPKPTITEFAKEMGIPRTTMNRKIKESR